MPKLEWDKVGEKLFEAGVEKGVLFPYGTNGYETGVAWNGLTAVNENPSGAESTPFYADNIKYLNLVSTEDFAAGIEALTYPEEFEECDGTKEIAPGVMIGQQKRKSFGFSYVSKVGNDVDGIDHGYKLHIVYGCMASPTDRGRSTINENPDVLTFSWDVSTTPVEVPGYKPTAHVIIDSTKVDAAKLAALEDILYGTASTQSRLPMPAEISTLFNAA